MIAYRWVVSTVVAVAIVLPGRCAAQQPGAATAVLGVAVGTGDFHQRDDYVAPVTFHGAILSTSALFERRSGRTLVGVEGHFGLGHTNSSLLPRDVHQHVAQLSFAVLHELTSVQPPAHGLALFAGGGVSTFGGITDVVARDATTGYSYRDWSYYWSHSVDVAVRAELSASRRTLAVRVTAPVFRLVARPNNGKDFNGDNAWVSRSWPRALTRGRPEYAWDRPVLFAQTELRQSLGGRLQFRAAYDFTYASSDRPLPLGMYMNRFLVGMVRRM